MSEVRTIQLAVFASGEGTNLRRIYRQLLGHEDEVKLALVVSNNSGAGALQFAREHDLGSEHVSAATNANIGARMLELLDEYRIDLIALAGYLKRVPEQVVSAYSGRMLNIHPALLPSFGGTGMYGIRVHEAVLARGCKVSGATVHLVTSEYDEGPIVMQRCCAVHDDDTPATLRHRVQQLEHAMYPEAILNVARALRKNAS